jgi:hypothetical protein
LVLFGVRLRLLVIRWQRPNRIQKLVLPDEKPNTNNAPRN